MKSFSVKKNVLAVLFMLLVLIYAFIIPQKAFSQEKFQIPAGTVLIVKTNTTISPTSQNVGDTVDLAVSSDVIVGGKVVFKAGSRASGEITMSKPKNYIGIPAKIGLVVHSAQAVDETTVLISGTKSIEGKDNMAPSIGLSLICCVLFALWEGGDAVIAPGTQITASVSATTTITVK